ILRGPRNSAQRRLSNRLTPTSNGQSPADCRLSLKVFNQSNMGFYRDEIAQVIDGFLAGWQPGERCDLLDEMRRLSRAIAGKLIYGIDANHLKWPLLAQMDDWLGLSYSSYVRLLQADWPLTPYRRLLGLADEIETQHQALLRARSDGAGRGLDALSLLGA